MLYFFRNKPAGRWVRNKDVVPCSDKVESGTFFGPDGGHLMAFRRFRVGLDFDVTMQIKPRNVSGVLLAIQVLDFQPSIFLHFIEL